MMKLTTLFTQSAQAVSATAIKVPDAKSALDQALSLCLHKEACPLLVSGCDAPISQTASEACPPAHAKTFAAPGLAPVLSGHLSAQCAKHQIIPVFKDLRAHVGGIDGGFSMAELAIAETGTLVLASHDEDQRLASMLCEVHAVYVSENRIFSTFQDAQSEIERLTAQAPGFVAFITGASRTADIERVLALGVHGPLELHIFIGEADNA